MMDEHKVAAKVAGRKAAEELVSLLSVPDGHGADYADILCETLRALLPKRRVPEPEKPIPIARLGAMQMNFGIHQGKTFDEIPLEYLDWLCRSQEDMCKNLRAYLTHPDLKSRRPCDQ